jgi:hypothetical protein
VGVVNLQRAVVVDETELAKSVLEKAHPRARRSDHFSKCLLSDFLQYRLRLASSPKLASSRSTRARRFSQS